VLDNCEHVLTAAAELINDLLRRAAQVSVLATSRELLDIGGEAVWQVPSLSLVRQTVVGRPEPVGPSEAVRLFVDRAQAVQPGFELSEPNRAAIERLFPEPG
jgi:non-specific serine/threonine protein kinase